MRKNHLKSSKLVSVSIVAFMTSLASTAHAQDSNAPTEDEIIVVGTAGGQGTSRQDAAFAVTSLSAEDIAKIAPASSSDLLKSVPGVWVESSGGTAAGSNIDVRGLPGGGDTPFVTQSLNGSPLYGQSAGISFFATDALVRIDDSVVAVEAVRGGPGSVFARGEAGLTVNYRIREGGDEQESGVRLTTALNHNDNRIDAYTSGPLGNETYYSLGGYVRGGSGVRDTGFNSEKGYQLTAQLTKYIDRGKVNVYGRVLDDHGQWVLPISLNNADTDLGTFSQLGNANRQRSINFGPGIDNDLSAEEIAAAQADNPNLQVTDDETLDFGDGRGFKGAIVGANFEHELTENLTLRNNLNYVQGTNRTLGLVPNGGAATVGSVLESQDVMDAGITSLTVGGSALNSDDYIQNLGYWAVFNDLNHFSNDFSLNFSNGTHNLTVGYYVSSFGLDSHWSIGNPAILENAPGGGFVFGADANGDSLGELDPTFLNGGFNFNVDQTGDSTVNALYLANEFTVNDKLTLDAAGRFEYFDTVYQGDLGGILDGIPDVVADIDDDVFSYTVGANYAFSDDFGAFARWSDGHRLPGFDNIREGALSVFDVKQSEIGVKYSSDWLDLYGTGFWAESDQFSDVVGSANATGAFETRTIGLEIEGEIRMTESFSTAIIATIQDAEITSATDTSIEGNRVLRQPDFQLLLRPTYTQNLGNFDASVYGSVQIVGDRFGDNNNSQPLDGFTEIGLGAKLGHESGFYTILSIDNLTNSDGFTEGDPRAVGAFNARPIFGRSVKLSVGYDF